jgi:hypothetical protein
MENLDIIILTSIVTTLFIVFLITLWREFNTMTDTDYQQSKKEGPRGQLVNFIGNLMEDKTIDKEQVFKAMSRTIADMENDGIYFPTEVKQELEKQRDELYCEYSNLPSVKSYES